MVTTQPRSNKNATASFSLYVVLCLILAVMLRAMIPVGYMPDLKTNQPFKIVVCTLNGPKTVIVDSSFDPAAKGDHRSYPSIKDHNGPCDFSINTAFISNTPYTFTVAEQIAFLKRVPVLKTDAVTTNWFFGNAASRAPPVFVIV
jgi:hypothetical protein